MAQGSFSADIADAKSISDDRIDQINALKKILIKRKYSSFPDSLGLVNYAIAYRHRILGDDLNVIKSAAAGVEKFNLQNYSGYQLPFLHSFLGESYTRIGALDKAVQNYQHILDGTPDGRAITVYGYAAFQASDIYRNVEDYRTALDFIEYVTNGTYAAQLSPYDLMDLHLSASICHSNLKTEDALVSAQSELEKAISTSKAIEDLDTWQRLELDQQQAFINLTNGDEYSAAALFERNLSAVTTLSLSDPSYGIDAADIASNISYTYQQVGDFPKAYSYALRAQSLLPSSSDADHITTEFLIYNNLATALEGSERIASSLEHINKALDLFPTKDWNSSPNKKLILQGLFDKSRIVSKNSNAKEALEVTLQLDALFDTHIEDQLSAYSVRNLKAKGTEYYQFGIDLAYQAKDIDAYWLFSEKMKGLQLLEANLANQSNDTSPTNTSLNEVKKRILRLNYLADNNQIQAAIDSLNLELSAAKKQRIELSQKVKSESQSDFQSIIEITDLQQNITDEVVIQYQAGSDYMYGLTITKDNVKIQQLGTLEDITNAVSQLRDLAKNPDSDLSAINDISRQLYDILIAPFEITGERIIIILDERLYTLPFDILQDKSGGYLISSSSISMNISGSFLAQDNTLSKKKLKKLRNVHVVQPQYGGNGELAELPFATEEAELIQQSYKIDKTNTESISKRAFDSLMQNAAVLHYSGHAIANAGTGERSYLALSNDEELSSRLLLGELYTNQTNAQMVVLSACNTGTGQIIKGEGVESLARGFLYAGAQSVINTLWTVDDQSTAFIVGDIYKQLKAGERKDVALRAAKMKYLATREAFLRHPYYWSGIVAVGDMSTIQEFQINWFKHVLLLLLLIVLAWFLTWRHSKRPFPKLEFFPKID